MLSVSSNNIQPLSEPLILLKVVGVQSVGEMWGTPWTDASLGYNSIQKKKKKKHITNNINV